LNKYVKNKDLPLQRDTARRIWDVYSHRSADIEVGSCWVTTLRAESIVKINKKFNYQEKYVPFIINLKLLFIIRELIVFIYLMRKIIGVVIGIVLILSSIGVLVDPVSYSPIYRTNIDVSNVKWPFSFILFSFGIFCIYIALFKKSKKVCYWICPKCEDVFQLVDEEKDYLCQECNINLKKLEGFFEHKKRKEPGNG
jgi:hypothetical protein